jgi:branched-chain amino acid transport system substrate-binding protein
VIVSDLPVGANPRLPARQMADAIAFVLRARHYRAGGRTVGYRSCDDWSGASAVFDPARCRANGEAYARTPAVLAVIGPYNSGCALRLIPATNAAAGGPLPVVSPTATSTELTRSGVTTPAGLPASLYPAGIRSFARLLPTDDDEGAALAREAKALGAERVVVLTAGSYGETISRSFVAAARTLGLHVAARAAYDPGAPGYAALARKVAGDSPDAVLVAGLLDENAGAVIGALRARLGTRVELIGSGGLLPISALFARAGPAARGVHVSLPGLDASHLGADGRAFVRAFGASRGGQVDQASIYAAAAAELVLDAIARSDGTRRGVLAELQRTRSSGILGPLRLDRNGDVTPRRVTIVRAARAGGSDALQNVDGATWERTVAGRARSD